MNKKVAFCINDLSLAGAENITFNIFINLLDSQRISNDSMLILLNNKIDSLFLKQIEIRKIKITFLNKKENSYFFYNFLKTLITSIIFFKKNKFDTIYVNLFPALFIISIVSKLQLLNNCKLIFTEHSVSNNRPKSRFYNLIERIVYKEYDKIICISDNVRSALISRIGFNDKIITIRNGLPPILTNDSGKVNIRAELKIPLDSKLLLMTSRIGDGKDHLTLFRAFENIFSDELYLLFIGEGDFSPISSLITNVKLKNNVKFLGKRVDARSIMREVNINILSSAYEGVSGVTLEAFESMRPFLGSNVSGIKELVGTSQCLFEFGDKDDLSEKILLILNNEDISRNIIIKNKDKLKEYDFNYQVNELIKLF